LRVDRRQVLGAAASAGVGASLTPLGAAEAADARVSVRDLGANGLIRPLGLDRAVELSWKMAGEGVAARQTACRVRAATSETALASGPLLWDSGAIETSRDTASWGGPALSSAQRVWWTVQIADAEGRWSAFAAPTWFETGLLAEADWNADWIEAETPEFRAERLAGLDWLWGETAIEPGPRAFRWRFEVPSGAAAATVMIAAKDSLRGLWLDGRSLLADGQRTAWGQGPVFDLGALSAGPHVLAVEIGLRTDEARPVIGGALATILRLTTTDGAERRTGVGQWRTALPGEDRDWIAPGFDDVAWPAATPATTSPGAWPLPAQGAVSLRRAFTVDRPVVRARLYATALGAYEARLNGAKVGDALLSPETTDFRSRALYQVHDVTDRIVRGDNLLGAVVADGFFASPFSFLDMRYAFGPPPRRFRALLVVDHPDGSSTRIATGPEWRSGPSAITASEIYDGETHDARLTPSGWDRPGFDAAGWTPAIVGDAPKLRLDAQPGPFIRATRTLRPRAVTQPRPDVRILDFGQNFTGWCRLKVRGPAGATVRLRFAEALTAEGGLNLTSNRRALQTDAFILAGNGEEVFEPAFTYHGFRYVEVTGWPGDMAADAVEGVVIHSDAALTGAFRCTDPLVEQIWRNTLWSQRSNFTGVPTDCPQRDERMGWTGDAQIFWDAAAFNMDVDAFSRRYLDDIRAGQAASGEMPDVAPYWAIGQNTPGWADASVVLPHTVWRRAGTTGIVEDNWSAMRRWNDRLLALNPDHVWTHVRGLDYGDWLSVDAKSREDVTTPKELISTAYWARSTGMLAEMARATGRADEAGMLEARRDAIVRAWRAAFVGADGLIGNDSQTSHVLGLRFGLTPQEQTVRSAARLRADIARRGDTLSTGFIGTPYILDALADHGHEDMAVSLLLQRKNPSWGYMIDQGATTIWERWTGSVDGLVTGSLNHYALGAIIGFLYRRVAGIAETAPGFERIEMRPIRDRRIASAGATYESARGRIRIDWRRDAGGDLTLEAEVPANAVAAIHLPVTPGASVRSGRHSVGQAGPVRLIHRDEKTAVVEAVPGRHILTVSA
jgi:alpha-L-rhamnosidase